MTVRRSARRDGREGLSPSEGPFGRGAEGVRSMTIPYQIAEGDQEERIRRQLQEGLKVDVSRWGVVRYSAGDD